MRRNFILLGLFTAFCFISCSKTDPYSDLVNSAVTGDELLARLNLFEKEHTEDFRSKIDLANYFILIGDYNSCYEYLLRAESVIKNCPKGEQGKKYMTLLYGMRSQVELYSGNYELAHTYVDKALKVDKKNNAKYNYLKAQIYVAEEDIENALSLFDSTYAKLPEELTKEDRQAYMYLLANAKRYEDCKPILESYLENEKYFYGLGSFASGVYESLGELEKAVLFAYLDYEYYSCYNGMNKEKFFSNLDSLVVAQDSAEKMFRIQDVINLVKSRVDESVVSAYSSDLYPAKYIAMLNKIRSGEFTSLDIQPYLDLEKYFTDYPSYYWNAWKGFCQVSMEDKSSYIPLLNRILLLGNNIYAYNARKELGLAAGLSENEAGNVLLPSEIEAILDRFEKTCDLELLEPLYAVISLPENVYELNALAIMKGYKNNVAFRKELERKMNASSGRLKERLQFVLLN